MARGLTVKLVEDDDDLLDIVPLKQADDSEFTGKDISEDKVLEKIINIKEYNRDFWIARLGQQPAGYAIGKGKEDNYRLEKIFVKDKYRGNEIGVKLQNSQAEFAREKGFDQIFSNVSSDNRASIRMFQKAGYSFYPNPGGYIVRLRL